MAKYNSENDNAPIQKVPFKSEVLTIATLNYLAVRNEEARVLKNTETH